MVDFQVQDYINKFKDIAKNSPNKEICGLVILDTFYQCKNLSNDPHSFILDPLDYIKYSAIGTVQYICHSHLGESAKPTPADSHSCNNGKVPWLIYSIVSDNLETVLPENYVYPYEGRPYFFGTLDCWGLVMDVLKYDCNIEVGRYILYTTDWYKAADNILENKSAEYDFVKVDFKSAKKYDIILFKSGFSRVPNHVGILYDNNKFLHHVENRKSTLDTLSGYWLKAAVAIYRHKELV